jgi:hypothetical protein
MVMMSAVNLVAHIMNDVLKDIPYSRRTKRLPRQVASVASAMVSDQEGRVVSIARLYEVAEGVSR